jgi:hypothetical protein
MFQNAFIDIAIGLVLMYLVLSLLCTVVNEWVANRLHLRAAGLRAALESLLDNPQVRGAFYSHGLIASTQATVAKGDDSLRAAFRRSPPPAPARTAAAPAPSAPPPAAPPAEHPAYLSSRTFALALIGSLNTANPIPGIADVAQAINALPPSKIRDSLQANLTAANNDLDQFRKNVATWFDDSMDRLSGSYKRHLKLISIVVGFLAALALNADSISVGSALWSDSSLRAQMIQAATATAAGGLPTRDKATNLSDVEKAVKTANEELRPLPIGWSDEHLLAATLSPGAVLLKLLGVFATALALSLGAPFWFDTLSKFVNIRGAGEKPKREDARS